MIRRDASRNRLYLILSITLIAVFSLSDSTWSIGGVQHSPDALTARTIRGKRDDNLS